MQHKVEVFVNNEDSLSNVEQWIKDAVADMFEMVYEREGNEGELIVIAQQNKGSAEQQTDNTGSMCAAQIFADREVAIFMGLMADSFSEFCKKVNDGRQKLHTT